MNPIFAALAGLLLAAQGALAGGAEHHHDMDASEHHQGMHHEMHEHDTSAVGEPGDASQPSRKVTITMKETPEGMIYAPDTVSVSKGEQIEFDIENAGTLDHEFVLGTKASNQAHKHEMEENPEMEHEEPNAVEVDPGEKATLLWRFTNPGTFEYACLIPGHYEAGMHGTVTVK